MPQIMKVRWVVGWVMILMLVAAIGYAQQPAATQAPAATSTAQQLPQRSLSLAEALDVARHNSPDYLSTLNDRWGPSAQERSSLLNLITPNASLSAGQRRTAAGTQYLGTTPYSGPTYSSNSWSLNLSYSLSWRTIAARGQSTADARSADAVAAGALITLETSVRTEYLNLLQMIALRDLAQRSLERAREGLNLAQARYSVGQGTLIDVRTNEVGRGRAEVNLLSARQDVDNQTITLFSKMGVPAPADAQVVPTDSFPVAQPAFREDSLIRMALEANPVLNSLRAKEGSARWATRSAVSAYLPSFGANASLGGQSQTVGAYSQPFGVDSVGNPINLFHSAASTSSPTPLSVSFGVTIPLYDGFANNDFIQSARAFEDDARHAIRARELSVRAAVSTAYRALVVDWEKIALQLANKAAALEALDLATQRYRVGSGSYLELLDARLTADQADVDYVKAVYDYHRAIAALENAVGRPLR